MMVDFECNGEVPRSTRSHRFARNQPRITVPLKGCAYYAFKSLISA